MSEVLPIRACERRHRGERGPDRDAEAPQKPLAGHSAPGCAAEVRPGPGRVRTHDAEVRVCLDPLILDAPVADPVAPKRRGPGVARGVSQRSSEIARIVRQEGDDNRLRLSARAFLCTLHQSIQKGGPHFGLLRCVQIMANGCPRTGQQSSVKLRRAPICRLDLRHQ